MISSTLTRRVLVVGARQDQDDVVHGLADDSMDVVHANSFDDAVQILRTQSIDLVISQTGDFLALERAAVNQQAGLILETIGQGVCVMDLAGKLVWHNQRLNHLPPDLLAKVSDYVVLLATHCGGEQLRQHKKVNFPSTSRSFYEVHFNPITEPDGKVSRVAIVVEDATDTLRLRQKIDAIDAAGRELVCFERDTKLTVPARLDLIEKRILRFVREVLHYDKFCIRALDKRDNRLTLLCSVGLNDHGKTLELFALPEGNGISGYVAATGRSYICNDVARDPRYLIGIDNARSSLTVPLKLHDRVVGVLNIESEHANGFSEDDRQFAEIFGRYVALALDILDLLVFERFNTSGQIVQDVSKSISSPLNDIQTEAQSLIDDYIGNDELRRRLQTILDAANDLRTSVRDANNPNAVLNSGAPKAVTPEDKVLFGKRVLVADDNDMLRETIADVLSKYGCEVSVATNGNEAYELLMAGNFDLMLSDIKMPGRNGYELFAAARTNGRDLPVILMTGFGYDPNHCIVKASKEGLAAVLFKPFKTDQLLAEVRTALSAAKK